MYWESTSPKGSVKRKAWSIAPLAALRRRQPFVGPSQAGQDRQSGRVGRGVAQGAELVLGHVPDRFLGRVPQAVGMRQLDAVGVRKQRRIGRPRHAVQLVGGVGVLVPDEQVRIAALAGVVAAAVRIRSVLIIALDDGIRPESAPARCRFRPDSCR